MAKYNMSWLARRSKGVHPPHHKVSANKPIERAPLPSTVYLPVSQHLGAPCKAVVKRNDKVKTGQVIAEPGGFVSSPIHATVSGKVSKVTQAIHFITGKPMDVVVIESDGKDEWTGLQPADLSTLTKEDVLNRIKAAGIVGMGGATFPTHVKLSPPPGKEIDTIIVNGAECEPWITSDHRLMLEQGDKILSGLKVMLKALPVQRVIIGIENNKPDAIEHMQRLVSQDRFDASVQVAGLKTLYPMGGEKTLTKVLLGREVPIGGLPLDIGVVVQNVGTVKAMHDAVIEGRPLVERAVTVTGMVGEPKNLMARFGTTISDLLNVCGGIQGDADEIIFGGPMMGITQYTLDTPIIKGTNCILVKKAREGKERDCIRCSRCINHCPMNLMPTMYVQFTKRKKWVECGEYHIDDCIECGACSYSCPASIPLVQYIKTAKAELRKVRSKK